VTFLAGVDIGGTKCAVCLGKVGGAQVEVVAKRRFDTPPSPSRALAQIQTSLDELLSECSIEGELKAIGISCGGPLDSRRGLILSPPNLPNWDGINVVTPLKERYGVPTGLQNDANACALAEWQWGAGRGFQDVVFLTFGTGMGAGLILDGRLYSGANDMAGEVGHLRLDPDGPVGYGKAGSFEGFCSGGGIAQLARSMAKDRLLAGHAPLFCRSAAGLPDISAASVADAAAKGDPLALEVFEITSRQLGRGLAVLVDILNPERIIIGSIFTRQQALLEAGMLRVLREEALPLSLSVCQIVPAGLGEAVGDLASLSVGLNTLNLWQHSEEHS